MFKRSISFILSLLMLLSVVFFSACRKEFTVRFHANGGTLVSGEEVQTVKDAKEIIPPVYEKEGYILSFDKIIENITEDAEVYAVWTPINYKLSFDANGGTFFNKTISIALGEKLSNLPIPTKDGYIFTGWYIGETLITDGYKWNFTEDKLAKATYVEDDDETFSITYDLGGGVLDNIKTYYSKSEGEFVLSSPTKDGYEFLGWRKDGETEIKNPMTVLSGTEGNLKFIACYSPKTYEVSFDANGGSQIATKISAIFDKEIGALPTPTKDGFVFLGWFYGEKQVVSGLIWNISESVTLVAKWKEEDGQTFSITYDLGGGKLENLKNHYSSTEEDFYLPTPSKDGYVFKGYIKDGETEVVNPVTIKKGTTGNLKFMAVWERLYVFRFELSREVRRMVSGKVFYTTAYCTVNGKSYVDDIRLVEGQTLNLPKPSVVNEDEDQFFYNFETKKYMYWVIDVPKEELGGAIPDSKALVIYSGDVVTKDLLRYADEDGVITIRPRIITLYVS